MQMTVHGKNRPMYLKQMMASVMLLFFSAVVPASGVSQNITLSLKNVPLERAFREIEKKTIHRFVYTKEMAAQGHPVTIDVRNTSLTKILELIFDNQPLEFTLDDKFITVRFKAASITPAQTRKNIQGKVLNEKGEPLRSATVRVKEKNLATATGEDGSFYLKDVDENDVLVVSNVGYSSKEIPVKGQANFIIQLNVSIIALDETVVIAYGTTTRRLNTGTVSKVRGEEIEKQPVSNPIAALQGRVPGMLITQSNGLPGSVFKVQIRGQNSLQQGNEPLYIVDGVPFLSEPLVQRSGLSANNPLNTLNPADIESIEVLKDADATAIYGSRGANGVILITTKKAGYGKARLDVSSYAGFGKASRLMNLMDTREYLAMRREAFSNDGVTPALSNAYDLLAWDTTRYTNWQKLLVGGTARSTNTEVRFSAGTINTRFSFGANYYKEKTVFPSDKSGDRMAFNLNGLHTSSDNKLNASITANYGSDKNNLPRQDLTSFILLPPNTPRLYDSLGKLNWRENGFGFDNPLAKLDQKYKGVTDMLTASASIGYRFLPWLNIKSVFGYTTIQLHELSTFPIRSQDPQLLPTGSSSLADNQVKSWIIEPQADFFTSLGKKGKLTVLIGSTFQDKKNRSTIMDGSGFTNDYLIEAVSSAPVIKIKNDFTEYKYRAVYGRMNYNWDAKYLLNITGRRDGSSRFGPGKQFANFGAIGAGWIFSKEKFIQNALKFLSFGKLRASFGTTGNDQIGNYQYLDSWTSTTYPYQGQSSLEPTRLANADYSWELTRKWEVAMEAGVFDNRILLNINWYLSRTENQIVYYPVASQTGFSSILKNFPGLVQNRGWEFEMNTVNIRRPSFTWTSSFNLSLPQNELVKFPGLENTTYANSYRIGEPVNVRIGYRFLGVDPLTGLYKFDDIDKDGKLDAKDYLALGSTNPKYYGGFQNTLSYKGVELSFLLQFVNQDGVNPTYRSSNAGGISNQSVRLLGRWTNSGDNALYQKYSQGTGPASTAAFLLTSSDAVITDASFIRLKTASLTWTLPQAFTKKLKMEYCKFFVRGQNLFVITDYVGSDPESQSLTALPPLKMIVGGLQLSF